MRKIVCALVILIGFISCKNEKSSTSAEKQKTNTVPNIVIINFDDLGYGDVSFNGSKTIQTPNMDSLALNGVRFTNAYAASATCTPSRYSLLTGIYPWRKEKAKILPGNAPLLIDTSRVTLPKMLQNSGYTTGIVGKWHLGLGSGDINWNAQIQPGPNEVGFDYSYILAATQDRVPTVYIKNGYVVGLDKNDPIEVNYKENFEGEPTALSNPEMLKMKWEHGHNNSIVNGIPRIGFMKGGDTAKWNDEEMANVFLKEAQNYVKTNKKKPFFLYYALQQPHVPRTPNPKFVGTSGMGPRGDVIKEADWCIGEFIKTLKEEGVLENTLIVLTSDNGPVLNDGYYDDAVEKVGNHKPWGDFRGGKYSMYEAGTRVPFFTYWKGKIKPGVSNALFCQTDLFSSLAQLVKSNEKAKDSEALLPVLMGESTHGREQLTLQGSLGTFFRKGDWAMIPPSKGPKLFKNVNIESGASDKYQLYNLKEDIGEQNNLSEKYPDKLEELKKEYQNSLAE
ncbi:sulfatase family protein [Galbibacter pacificus]|uniref:Arylsulfatase n=1 Tax=Galbibacter pacificus TaxID=2996052 RepID=A0ABT6FQN8_9FLAO|nr:arylsulfatase [Galbibacter pacificus]MDG3581942.1 arylsulfatase [Galbibacter pacificus]MDG3585584.1 arylsulfatase [Galbibacter pacificus]